MATTQARRRLTKHQLKEDAFSTWIFKAREWVELNLRLVIFATVGLIAVVAIAWSVSNYFTGRESAANALFGQAGVELRSNNLTAAIIDLQKVLDDYGNADIAGLACFELATAHFQQRNFDDARVKYQLYLDKYADDPMLVGAAWAGLATIDEHAKDYAAAVEKNFKAADINPKSFYASEYLRNAIRCAIAAGDSVAAVKAFHQLEQYAPDQRIVDMARQNLIEHRYLAGVE